MVLTHGKRYGRSTIRRSLDFKKYNYEEYWDLHMEHLADQSYGCKGMGSERTENTSR